MNQSISSPDSPQNDPDFRFEPMTIGMILDRTFKLYMKNAVLMLGIVLLTYIPFLIISTIPYSFLPEGLDMQDPEQLVENMLPFFMVMGSQMLAGLIYLVIFFPLSTGAATIAISERMLGREITILGAYRHSLKRFKTLAWSYFIVGLLITLGMFACYIPGLILYLFYILLTPVIMLEGRDSKSSRQRAWDLLKGFRGNALAVVLIFWAMTMAVAMGGSAIFMVFGMNPFTVTLDQQWMLNVTNGLLSQVVAPLKIIGLIMVYYDCRIRKEGYDLELLTNELHPDSAEVGF